MLYGLNVGRAFILLYGGVIPSNDEDEDDHVIGVPWFDGLDKSSNENGLLSPSPRVDDELFEYSSFFEHHEHRVVQQWRYVLNIVKNEADIFYYIVIFIHGATRIPYYRISISTSCHIPSM